MEHDRRTPWGVLVRILHGVGLVLGTVMGLIVAVGAVTTAQGLLARERLTALRLDSVLPRSGLFGEDRSGPAMARAVMGDSLAVGYGADDPSGAPGVLIAEGLVAASDRPVQLTNVAEVGAESTALVSQLAHLRARVKPDVVVVLVGANDVMRLKRLTDALWPLSGTVRQLRAEGAQVIVATCPDLGTVRPFMPLLRFFAHRPGDRHAACGRTHGVARRHSRTAFQR